MRATCRTWRIRSSSPAALLEFFAAHPITVHVPGDFSGDGIVDAADYVVWRKGLGTEYTQDDYDVWRAHFGATSLTSIGAGSGAAGYPLRASAEPLPAIIPEPTTASILLVGILALSACRRIA